MAAHDARAIASFGLYDNDNAWVIPATDPDRADKWGGILTYGLLLTVASAAPHVFDGTAAPGLPPLIPQELNLPVPREEETEDIERLNRVLRERLDPVLTVVNAIQRGVHDKLRLSRHAAVPAAAKDGDVYYFEAGVVGANEGFYGLSEGTWTQL